MNHFNNIMRIIAVVFGALLVTGAGHSSASEPCTANDKLLDIVKAQQQVIVAMYVDAKKEADAAKKNYLDKLAELEKTPCKAK